MSGMLIRPASCLRGEIALPGDKSISHRAAIVAAIATGESRIDNYSTSADCASTLECLRHLGVQIRQQNNTVWVKGVGLDGLRPPAGPLDCGNSGTTKRLLAGLLAGQAFDSVLTGDASLLARPMNRIAEPLNQMGAAVETTGGHGPLKISGGRTLRKIEYTPAVASAQIKSCILLAGLFAEGNTSVIEKHPTRDHTERMLRRFGGHVAWEYIENVGHRYTIDSSHRDLTAQDIVVPGDISAAAFFIVPAVLLDGSEITLRDVGLNAKRSSIVSFLDHFGAKIEIDSLIETPDPELDLCTPGHEPSLEPAGDIRVTSGFRSEAETVLQGSMVSSMIDEIPIVAVLGSQLKDGLEVRDARELRVKESDRIAAIIENLRRMNADVEEFDDGFRVMHSRLKGARVDSFADHRIAMAFAIAGLLAEKGETEIDGAECVDISFPGFFEVLKNAVVYK